MAKRVVMNSGFLKNQYDEYADFFTKHDLIISLPHILHWGHSITKASSNLKIKQKVPTKMYLGVNFVDSSDICINNVTYFCQKNKCFDSSSFEKLDLDKNIIVGFLNDHISGVKGMEINLLSENERGHGFSFSGVLVGLFAILIDIINSYEIIEEKYSINSEIFGGIYDNAIKLDKLLNGNPTGVSFYTAMSKYSCPIVQWNNSAKMEICEFLNIDKKDCGSLPIDFGIIYYGMSYSGDHIKGSYESIKSEYEGFVSKLKNYNIGDDDNFGIYDKDIFDKMSFYLNAKLLDAWEKVITQSYDENIVNHFIDVINEHGLFNSFLENENKIIVDSLYLFDKNKSFGDEKIGFIPVSSGKVGGSLLFVTHKQKSRDTISKMITKLSKLGYGNVSLEYSSYDDGFGEDGFILEQYLSKGKYSNFVNEWDVMYENNSGISKIGDHRKLLKKYKNGIIFDDIDKKIYFNGKGIGYKDLRSQSGTIEIFMVLLNSYGEFVSNKKIPYSSYSKNKNEMVGKIIVPFKELVKNKLGKKIDVTVSGSIYDFDIMIEKTNINIGVIRKVVN